MAAQDAWGSQSNDGWDNQGNGAPWGNQGNGAWGNQSNNAWERQGNDAWGDQGNEASANSLVPDGLPAYLRQKEVLKGRFGPDVSNTAPAFLLKEDCLETVYRSHHQMRNDEVAHEASLMQENQHSESKETAASVSLGAGAPGATVKGGGGYQSTNQQSSVQGGNDSRGDTSSSEYYFRAKLFLNRENLKLSQQCIGFLEGKKLAKQEKLAEFNRLYGQNFYEVVRLGISTYDLSSHDDRFNHHSSQHDKSLEWDASGGVDATGFGHVNGAFGHKKAKSSGEKKEATRKSTGRTKGQYGGHPGVDPSEQLEDWWTWAVMPPGRSDRMMDVLDLAKKIAVRDKLDKCVRALEKMESARRENWMAANASSQATVYVKFDVQYKSKKVGTGSWKATFTVKQQGNMVPSTRLEYIVGVKLQCFRGDTKELEPLYTEDPPYVLTMKVERGKKSNPPTLYATVYLQTRWSVKDSEKGKIGRNDRLIPCANAAAEIRWLAFTIEGPHSNEVHFSSSELTKTRPGEPCLRNGSFVVEKDRALVYVEEPVAPTYESEADQGPMGYLPQSYASGSTTVYTSSARGPLPQYGSYSPDGQGAARVSIAGSGIQHYDGDAAVSSITSRLDQTSFRDDNSAPTDCGGAHYDADADADDGVWGGQGGPVPDGRHPGFPQTHPVDYQDFGDEIIDPWNHHGNQE